VALVLLDTDIGSDIDDAVALAYLLAQKECDLLGITTVSGDPVGRAKLASAICEVAGQQVPIYPGAAQPFLIPQQQPEAPQVAALARWHHQEEFLAGEDVDFLRRTIRAHPHEITLLPIGPLTNIGLLFALDPEIPFLLKELVLMCGVFVPARTTRGGTLEWNAKLDPHATAIVYNAQVDLHRSIGLDVTTHVVMDAPEVRTRFDIPLLRPVLDFAEVWFNVRDHITFHDPLAAVSLFAPDVMTYERGQVTVETMNADLLGQTRWQPGAGPHEIGATVDRDEFFDHFFRVFADS
jgi:inosine-uridine nucleoside N-ribohydrolase